MGLFRKDRGEKTDYKKALSDRDFEDYQRLKGLENMRRARGGLSDLRQKEKKTRYDKSKLGKISRLGGGLSKLNQAPLSNVGSLLYNNKVTQKSGNRTGRRGRPFGTYDKRYASVGGVYSYRKILSAQLRERRLEAVRRSTISPQQQAILDQAAAREYARRTNIENQTFPDTRGEVSLKFLHDEADDAANLVP